jgi:dephospho-CoA kinase
MLLGLTGGYCAGKNAVASILEKAGWTCIDVDRLGHEAVDLARDAILRRFGPNVIGPDGLVDRKSVARIVFSDPVALADQEAIIHPIAIRLTDERIEAALSQAEAEGREAMVCVNAALLYRTPQSARCDAIIEVRAPLMLRLERARRRDGATLRQSLARISHQNGIWRLRANSACPIFVLCNRGSRRNLERKATGVLERVLALPQGPNDPRPCR